MVSNQGWYNWVHTYDQSCLECILQVLGHLELSGWTVGKTRLPGAVSSS